MKRGMYIFGLAIIAASLLLLTSCGWDNGTLHLDDVTTVPDSLVLSAGTGTVSVPVVISASLPTGMEVQAVLRIEHGNDWLVGLTPVFKNPLPLTDITLGESIPVNTDLLAAGIYIWEVYLISPPDIVSNSIFGTVVVN